MGDDLVSEAAVAAGLIGDGGDVAGGAQAGY